MTDSMERHIFHLLKKMAALSSAKQTMDKATLADRHTEAEYINNSHVKPLTDVFNEYVRSLPKILEGEPLLTSPESNEELSASDRRGAMKNVYYLISTFHESHGNHTECVRTADDFLEQEAIEQALKD
jgi:hypothetical protein